MNNYLVIFEDNNTFYIQAEDLLEAVAIAKETTSLKIILATQLN